MNTVYKLTGHSLKGDCIHFTNIFLQFTKVYLFNDVILCFKGLTEKQMIKSNISKDCSWSSCVKSWLTDQGRSKASYTQILNLWMQTPVIIPICALGVSMLPHSYRLFHYIFAHVYTSWLLSWFAAASQLMGPRSPDFALTVFRYSHMSDM